jgi:hypothetical protein
MMYAGRARLITHMTDYWGEDCAEFGDEGLPPGFGPLLVFEFPPSRGRDWWTYSTAGLSLSHALDGLPPMELIAYATERSVGLVDVLFQLACKDDSGLVFQAGDIVLFDEDPPDLGIVLSRTIGLIMSSESSGMLAFPSLETRQEDMRYLMARPGEDATPVRFLRVVGVDDAEAWSVPDGDHSWRLF